MLRCDEFQRRLFFRQQIMLRLLRINAFGGAIIDLFLHQRRQHPTRADRVAGHIAGGRFQPDHFSQTDYPMLGRHIRSLTGRTHLTVYRGNVDDPPQPLARMPGRLRRVL